MQHTLSAEQLAGSMIVGLMRDKAGRLPAGIGGSPLHYILASDAVVCPACANGENGSKAGETICYVGTSEEHVECSCCGADVPEDHNDGRAAA